VTEASKSPGYFAVVEPRLWTENRFYRIYVTSEELVGVWAGRANDISQALAAQGGLVGGLLAAAASGKKGGNRTEELAAKPFEELRSDHKHNFAIRFEDIESAEIASSSFWFRVNYSSIFHVGLLHVSTRARKRWRFAIASNEDMQGAIELLVAELGQKLRVGLTWDEGWKKYRAV
jgi:hypothetical protein